MNSKLRYIIPNLFTVSSLLAGLAALHYISNQQYVFAAWLITLSIVLDGLDGKSARLFNATSKFGSEADSFADFVAFGVVPGFLAWSLCLKNFGLVGMIIYALYVISGGFRLVRFNLKVKNPNIKDDFQGLPIPAGAAVVTSYILFTNTYYDKFTGDFLFMIIMLFTSFLMVSTVPYVAVNKSPHNIRLKYFGILILLAALILSIRYFWIVYIVIIWIYILTGFIRLFFNLLTSKKYKEIKG